MDLRVRARIALFALMCAQAATPVAAQDGAQVAPAPARQTGPTVRVTGVVRDQSNAITLPGVPVEVVGTGQVVYTDVDGRYLLNLPSGKYQVKVLLEGYDAKTIDLEVAPGRGMTADVGLMLAKFSETVVVEGRAVDVETSSAEAQLVERKQSSVISDNVGSQEMKQNGDGDAASAMTRVTGISVVDNQYVYVRGLGERYSNTTLSGSVLPTTEPDKKVVPLDLFPTGLIDSVQVSKSYSPDRSAEFAGGLVQIMPMKLPAQPVVDISYGVSIFSNATGTSIPLSPLGSRDIWGFDAGARELPSGIPEEKIVRSGIYTPDVGFNADQITGYGRLLDNTWRPASKNGRPGQNWSVAAGNRFGRLGVVASVTHAYKEQFVEEDRRFFRIAGTDTLDETNDYHIQTGTQRAQLGVVGNLSYQFTPNQRLTVENFYTHSGRDEGRFFQGTNDDNAREYRDYRLQFIEEGLIAQAVGGEHFFSGLANSRVDWRANYSRASRDEPDLREALYERPLTAVGQPDSAVPFTYADESQSGFRMFNVLDDDTVDVSGNWAMLTAFGGRPTQFKFGANYVERTRDFVSRRFHFIPITATKDGALGFNNTLPPEQIFVSGNIGTAVRFNEETRPTDAYAGEQTTTSGYGMVDLTLSARSRLIAGARVENFDQTVTTQDPFGLFASEVQAVNQNTDVFPGINFVQAVTDTSNVRLSYSTTVNRPEFRELAEFEFTDVIGNRAVRGNPELKRALIQNVDARWEMFSGGRGVIAGSVFYKYFDQPIERIVLAAVQPLTTYQNADKARNIGLEFEAARAIGPHLFFNANYTFVESKITLADTQLAVQTSSERPLAGQSKNLFNVSGEFNARGFSTRVLVNYFGDRIADVGANDAPDIIEQGRAAVDLVFSQRIKRLGVRLTLENLTDAEYRYTQSASVTETQRLYRLGRTIALSFGYNLF